MSDKNEISKIFGGEVPAIFDPNALMQSSNALPQSSDKPFLTFKDGEWTFGAEHAEIEKGGLWAVNPNSFKFGFVEWFEGEAGGEYLVGVGQPYSVDDLKLEFDSEHPDHQIAPAIGVEFLCIGGADENVEVYFKTSTKGGVDAVNKLALQIAKNSIANPEKPIAVISFDSSSYMHKKYKRKTYTPVLNIDGFTDWEFSDYKKSEVIQNTNKAVEETNKVVEDTNLIPEETAPVSRRRRR